MNDTIKYFCSKIFKHFLHPFPYFYLNLLLVPGCQWSEPQSSQSRRYGDLLCVSSHEQPLLLQHRLYHQAIKVMEVRAQRSIKTGEEISTRYVLPSMEQPTRLEYIKKVWDFICRCDRCQSPSALGSMFSGLKCGQCLHPGLLSTGQSWGAAV